MLGTCKVSSRCTGEPVQKCMVKVATTTKLRSGSDSMHQMMWLCSLEQLTERKIRRKLLLSAPALGLFFCDANTVTQALTIILYADILLFLQTIQQEVLALTHEIDLLQKGFR